jgi:Animal haem peroxidase
MNQSDQTRNHSELGGTPPQTPDPHYDRLMEARMPTYSIEDLVELADRMKTPDKEPNHDLSILSGTVYFGQFVDHDLTRDRTRLEQEPYPNPRETRNWRTPKLDLDSLYGNGPGGSLPAGDYVAFNGNRFQLGILDGLEVDLPRDQENIPQIPESRNDENLIISQLQVLFMKFHNRVVELLEDPNLDFPAPSGSSLFERARRFVVWHYQWLVRNCFLAEILHPYVFGEITQPGYRPRLLKARSGEIVALPVEFTLAAFRFGHSMVRNVYTLRAGTQLSLSNLLNHQARPLQPNQVIEWGGFFGGTQGAKNAAQRIDTTISQGLYVLSDRIVLLYKEQGPVSQASLAARTLLRGWKAGLPSGQELCRKAQIPFITFKESDRDYAFLKASGMLRETPLWYYLLHEAEMAGTNSAGAGGQHLGPLGSYVVGEVMEAVLEADLESYLNANWGPPSFRLSPGDPYHKIDSFQQFVAFASKSKMAARCPPLSSP